jgi:hypothetical protein
LQDVLGKLAVQILQVYELQQFCFIVQYLPGHSVGLGKPDASLVCIESEKHPPTEDFQDKEEHPVGILE